MRNPLVQENHGLTPHVCFKNVNVKYTTHSHGLKDFSLDVFKGEFLFLVGHTGAGKSTTLKLLTREVWHDSGNVFINQIDLARLAPKEIPSLRQGLGIVPQDYALLPKKKVWENIAYAMRACGHTQREVQKKVPEIIEAVKLGHRVSAYPDELSGGEQQRVAIGRALINNPPIILADEPTGNLDPENSWAIISLLKSLNENGTTVLVASHDITVVERLGARTVTLAHGQIISDVPARSDFNIQDSCNFAVVETEAENQNYTKNSSEQEESIHDSDFTKLETRDAPMDDLNELNQCVKEEVPSDV